MADRGIDVCKKTQEMIEASQAMRERQLARREMARMYLDTPQPARGQLHFAFKPASTPTQH